MKKRMNWIRKTMVLGCVATLFLASCGGGSGDGSTAAGGDSSAAAGGDSVAASGPEGLAAAEYLSGEYPELPADGETYNFSVAYASGENTESHKIMQAFQEALEYYSGGKMTLTLYPNGQLGSDAEIIASCVAGDIDIVLQCGSTHATFVPETQIFDTPFLFTGVDMDVIEETMIDSEFRDMYNAANEEAAKQTAATCPPKNQ